MNRARKAIAGLAVALLFLGLLPGCWDLEETENLGLVMGLGVGRLPGGEVRLTAQVANPLVVGAAPAVGGVTPGASISSK